MTNCTQRKISQEYANITLESQNELRKKVIKKLHPRKHISIKPFKRISNNTFLDLEPILN
jgi:hypothetical protein